MNTVRPFAARIVCQDWARRAVVAMRESLNETSDNPARIPIDPAAYDESAAALYVYRQRSDDASHTGVVCEVTMHAFVDGRIRGHEAVYARRVRPWCGITRRRPHRRPSSPSSATRARPSRGQSMPTCRTPPILDFAGPDGFQQTVWRVAEGSAPATVVNELTAASHYIADGHHRVAAALKEWRLAGTPADTGLLCVIHPIDDLRLSAFHRRVTGPVAPTDLIALLTPEFQVRPAPETPAPKPGSFELHVRGGWFESGTKDVAATVPRAATLRFLRSGSSNAWAGFRAARPTPSRSSQPERPSTSSPSGATPTRVPCSRSRRRPRRSPGWQTPVK